MITQKIAGITALAVLLTCAALHAEAVNYSVYPIDQNSLALEVKNESAKLLYVPAGVIRRAYPAGAKVIFRDFQTKKAVVFRGEVVTAAPDLISASLNINPGERLIEIGDGAKITRSIRKDRFLALSLGSLRESYKGDSSFWDALEQRLASGGVEFQCSFPVEYEKNKPTLWVHTQWFSMTSNTMRE